LVIRACGTARTVAESQVGRSDAHSMKIASLLWNLTRVALILLCGYQLILTSMDSQQAERMLGMTQLSREHHEAIPMTSDLVESVRQVLHRRNRSSLYYAVLLVILALSPYATARNV
jgi:hypothetical protein